LMGEELLRESVAEWFQSVKVHWTLYIIFPVWGVARLLAIHTDL
jgi:hypothetical protein